ncbi:MAG: Mfa1 family fimbria major subunit [Prevotellaceae bacterium]|jgi:hypothetical protein|nr:Mfa1 family fimbria major subunit [Prevotellaceae bacterium]
MNRKNRPFLWMNLLLCAIITSACTEDITTDVAPATTDETSLNTYIGFSVKVPARGTAANNATRATSEGNYRPQGTYEGEDITSRIDLYLLDANGVLQESRRFEYNELVWVYDTQGMQVVKPKDPFTTTAGTKYALVIINSPRPLITTAPADNYVLDVSNEFPLSGFGGYVDYAPESRRVFRGMFSGKSELTTINAGVTSDQVKGGANHITLSVERLVSRVIVTASPNIVENSAALGTFSNIQYSVAQGSKAIYLLPRTVDGKYLTPAYDYIPDSEYIRTAASYYCYEDIQTPTDVPANPATTNDPMAYLNIEGKFMLENTHAAYHKGNTAYVLVRAKFAPHAASIKDGGALAADGTFYVGGSDGLIYSSLAAATDPTTGTAYQSVYTYTGGKVLYHAWVNPDDLSAPTAAPTVRNNIYHININSFKTLGVNWNPLTPDINNPDPQPGGNEPPSPIAPEDPLSSVDTYMSVDIEVKNWIVNSYDIDF